jgi:hypothetical protein
LKINKFQGKYLENSIFNKVSFNSDDLIDNFLRNFNIYSIEKIENFQNKYSADSYLINFESKP